MNTTTSQASENQSDMMLWLAAAIVVGIGLTWLVISQPWSSGESAALPAIAVPAPPAASPATTAGAAADELGQTGMSLDNPLRMAQLAYEAGMLTEPEDYSAWALFVRALADDPQSETARNGLEQVADDLLGRGGAALEQGRFDAVKATVDRVLGSLPGHAGAVELAARLAEQTPRPVPRAAPVAVIVPDPAESAPQIARATAAREEPPPPVDPLIELNESFRSALAANQLLTPADASALHYVRSMLEADAQHELARDSRDLLVTEMLSRSKQSLEALDWDAARTWIDQAEPLAANPAAVFVARELLTEALVTMETEKLLPASALEVRSYQTPEYPSNALSRGIQGWVDIEFTVARDGTTQDVTVVDASHASFFRSQALEAIENWEFEPRIFLERAIEQRSYTRLNFVISD